MKKIITIAAVLTMAIAAGCTKMQPETIEVPQQATALTKNAEVESFYVWSSRENTIPESRRFGLAVTFKDGTEERIPFDWEVTDILPNDIYAGRRGTASDSGQWYATGQEVSVIRLKSTQEYMVEGQMKHIEKLAVISHSDDNI